MKNNQITLERWLILDLRQEIFKMIINHLIVPKSKGEEKLKKKKHNDANMSKGHRYLSWKNSSKKMNKYISGYNQKRKNKYS